MDLTSKMNIQQISILDRLLPILLLLNITLNIYIIVNDYLFDPDCERLYPQGFFSDTITFLHSEKLTDGFY